LDNFLRMLEHAEGINTLALVGEGEPLLHPEIFTMAAKVRESGRKALMISNGSQFTEEIIARLCEIEVVYVAVSIDSTRPEYFSRSRAHGDLAEVLRGMARLRAYRDAHGFRYPKIAVKGTLLDYNEGEMLAVVQLAREHGAEIFEGFQPLNPKASYLAIYPPKERGQLASIGRVARRISEQLPRARQLLRSCEEFMAEEGIVFGGQDRVNRLRNHCDERYVYALLSGDITPCCQVKDPVEPDWNLLEKPLSEILRTPSYENMRFNLWNGIFPAFCAGCGKIPRPLPGSSADNCQPGS
jgi:MoaA/NifB/PqqE/SkfB family radical SAM enzyme